MNFARSGLGNGLLADIAQLKSPKPDGSSKEIGLNLSGKFHVLLIGVNDYKHPSWAKLTSPKADIELLSGVLGSQYGATLHQLTNPNKEDVIGKIRQLGNALNKDDSLMIYFGGHGHRSTDGRKGYWILADGSDEPSSWFDHDELKSIIQRYEATNILIASDSCFSGLLTANFKSSGTQADKISSDLFNKYLKTKSIMTYSSGGLEEVPDTGSGDNSIFAYQSSNFFEKQVSPFTASQLHETVSRVVAGEGVRN